jgi:hypothetical protein
MIQSSAIYYKIKGESNEKIEIKSLVSVFKVSNIEQSALPGIKNGLESLMLFR